MSESEAALAAHSRGYGTVAGTQHAAGRRRGTQAIYEAIVHAAADLVGSD